MNRPENFETCPNGTLKVLDEKDVEITKLRDALERIVHGNFCLLAIAQEIAQEALDGQD